MQHIIPSERIESKIYVLRGKKVMLDRDIALLYGVSTKALNQAVRRNMDRFPDDFLFQLSKEEMDIWATKFILSKHEKMGLRKPPLAFTEQGVAMLSSVLKSPQAIYVNIQIMRTFTKLREIMMGNDVLQRKLAELEEKYDQQFSLIFDVLKKLVTEEQKPETLIGFQACD